MAKILSEINKDYEDSKNLSYVFVSVFVEILGYCLGAFVIDLKLFGRKNSMMIFFFLTSFFCFLTFILNKSLFLYGATVCRLLIGIVSVFCFQFTSEGIIF